MAEYIEREKLIAKLKSTIINPQTSFINTVLIGLLENAPAADVVEVRHGEWIYDRTYYEADECNCSLCNQLMTTAKSVRMNYCPNCGAKMCR